MDSGDWTVVPLGKIAELLSEKAGSTRLKLFSVTSGVGLVSQVEKFGREIAGAQYKNYYVIHPNDFAYNKSATKDFPEGFIACHQGTESGAVPNSIFTCFRVHPGASHPPLLNYQFANNLHGKWLRRFITVGARANGSLNVDDNDLLATPIPVPPQATRLAEQRKIADCLSSLDELIAVEGQKLDALKAHKQGLMQKLFPSKDENIPRLRFPEFIEMPEWTVEELKNCLEEVIDYRGKAPPKSVAGIPLITAKNVRFGWLDMSCDEYIATQDYDDWMSKGIPKAGDILFTTEAPLGNVAMLPSDGKFALGQRILTIRAQLAKCIPGFIFQSLLGPKMQKEINFHSTGSTAKGIKSTVFVTLSFCYPTTSEQQRISDCLSSLDSLIDFQGQMIDALKAQKRALMQQMFPVLKGVST